MTLFEQLGAERFGGMEMWHEVACSCGSMTLFEQLGAERFGGMEV